MQMLLFSFYPLCIGKFLLTYAGTTLAYQKYKKGKEKNVISSNWSFQPCKCSTWSTYFLNFET